MPTAFCSNHPDVEAVARCKGCRKLLCTKCRTRGHDGWYCGEDCLSKQQRQQDIVQAHDAGAKLGSGLMSKLIPLVVLLAVAGAGYWLLMVKGVRSLSDLQGLF